MREDRAKLKWCPQSPETDRSGKCLGNDCVWWDYTNRKPGHRVGPNNTQAQVDAFTAEHPLKGFCGATDWRANQE